MAKQKGKKKNLLPKLIVDYFQQKEEEGITEVVFNQEQFATQNGYCKVGVCQCMKKLEQQGVLKCVKRNHYSSKTRKIAPNVYKLDNLKAREIYGVGDLEYILWNYINSLVGEDGTLSFSLREAAKCCGCSYVNISYIMKKLISGNKLSLVKRGVKKAPNVYMVSNNNLTNVSYIDIPIQHTDNNIVDSTSNDNDLTNVSYINDTTDIPPTISVKQLTPPVVKYCAMIFTGGIDKIPNEIRNELIDDGVITNEPPYFTNDIYYTVFAYKYMESKGEVPMDRFNAALIAKNRPMVTDEQLSQYIRQVCGDEESEPEVFVDYNPDKWSQPVEVEEPVKTIKWVENPDLSQMKQKVYGNIRELVYNKSQEKLTETDIMFLFIILSKGTEVADISNFIQTDFSTVKTIYRIFNERRIFTQPTNPSMYEEYSIPLRCAYLNDSGCPNPLSTLNSERKRVLLPEITEDQLKGYINRLNTITDGSCYGLISLDRCLGQCGD